MTELRFPIVGMYYRPPAQALVNVLGIGTPLALRAEPDNEVHSNAVAVILKSADLNDEAIAALDGELANFGFTIKNILDQDEWQLGYVPRNMADDLRMSGRVEPGTDVIGEFRCAASGAPRIVIGVEP